MSIKKFALVVFIAVAVVIFSVFWQQSQQKQQPPAVPTKNVSRPILPSPIVTSQPSYRISTAMTTFPQALPIYNVTAAPQLKTLGSVFSSSLGLQGQPQEIPSTRGNIYIWTKGGRSVVANTGLSTLSFSGDGMVGETIKPSLSEYYAAADRALATLQLSNKTVQLVSVDPQYFQPNAGDAKEVGSPSLATSVQLNYQYAVNGVPVYAGASARPSVFVRLNAEAEVLTLTAYILPSLTTASAAATLVPIKDAEHNLLSGGGRLTDLVSGKMGDQPYYFDAPPEVSDVQSVVLAYYYAEGQNQLIPVYVFKGVGKINNKTVDTVTLVSAVK